uniref:Uncharacterized protein n=1 Tax=Solanum lycopersicum TaxID=4081 RepID=A0A3Q7HC90_SOLLC
MFCTSMIDVENELDIPSYLIFTSGVGFLGFLLYLSVWHDQFEREFNRSDSDLNIAANASRNLKSLTYFCICQEGYDSFRNHGIMFKETKGILLENLLR